MTAGNVLTCTGGTIAAGVDHDVLDRPRRARRYVGTIANTVTVDPNNAIFEADETNNSRDPEHAGRHRHRPDDRQGPTSPPGFDPIATNGTQTYTITVDNIGTQNATNIRVRDTLPAGTTSARRVGDHGFTCSHAGGVVDASAATSSAPPSEFYDPFGDAGDDTATIIIRVFAQPRRHRQRCTTKCASIRSTQIAEINEQNNIDFEDTDVGNGGARHGRVQRADHRQDARLSPANTVARNAVVTYQIMVGNDGTDPAVGRVGPRLPAGRLALHRGDRHATCSCAREVGNYVECVGGHDRRPGRQTRRSRSRCSRRTRRAPTPTRPSSIRGNAKPEGNETNNQART